MPRLPGGARQWFGARVLVIQEWWGLNPQMKGTADHLAENGFVALAPDLYRGELAGHDEMDKAGHLMTTLPAERAAADMSLAVDALRDPRPRRGARSGQSASAWEGCSACSSLRSR